jgi:putative tryptophan/tyrosine transport system substrate-binding protein
MIDRRAFAVLVSAGLLGIPRASLAQPAGKVWRVGFISAIPRPPNGAPPEPLRARLQALGYVEGKDVVYEGRWAEVHPERLPGLVAELVAARVDVIVTVGGAVADAARQGTATIPIVVVHAGDVLGTGLVASLGHPGGNLTGVNDQATVLSAKRLELLKETAPGATRVAVLWNAADRAMTLRYQEIEKAAKVLHMSVEPLGVREPDDFDTALSSMDRKHPDALMMLTDSLTNLNRQRVVDYAAANRIPAMYENSYTVRGGGLMSYGSDDRENYALAAELVAKILKGARPGDLPVEQPNRYFLVINQKTAKNLGLNLPQSLLLRADEVIE